MNEGHELSSIKGIGDARARWLEATFGARTVEDLAVLAPEAIEREVRAGGPLGVSRRAIESWVAQARALAAPTEQSARGADAHLTPDSDWKALASFVVEFQSPADGEAGDGVRTSVHYLERDRTQTWLGIDADRLSEWMLAALRADAPGIGAVQELSPPDRPVVGRVHADLLTDDDVSRGGPIPADSAWSVVFEWSVEGAVAPEPGDEWRLDVVVQPLLPGAPSLRLRDAPVRVRAKPGVDSYRERYDVRPGIATTSHWGVPYRATALLGYAQRGERSPHPAG
jgi:hypothetical protein